MITIPAKYFKALVQIVITYQTNLFETIPDREKLLRDVFENGFYIEKGDLDNEAGWGIDDTKYITDDKNWIFGFLCKVLENPHITTLPVQASSLKEIRNLNDSIVVCTPFFFNFEYQHLYTQSHWSITRTSNGASEIWQKALNLKLQTYIDDLDVQSIPEGTKFLAQMQEIKILRRAEFDLFGPNILNDERIRGLIKEFQPTGSRGLSILLKNYISGLKTDAEEFLALLNYLLKGGGKGVFSGPDKNGNNKVVKTESRPKEIVVSHKLDKQSDYDEIQSVFKEIITDSKGNINSGK